MLAKTSKYINQGKEKNLNGSIIKTRTSICGLCQNGSSILIKPKTNLILLSYYIDPISYDDYLSVFYKNQIIFIRFSKFGKQRFDNSSLEAVLAFDFTPNL